MTSLRRNGVKCSRYVCKSREISRIVECHLNKENRNHEMLAKEWLKRGFGEKKVIDIFKVIPACVVRGGVMMKVTVNVCWDGELGKRGSILVFIKFITIFSKLLNTHFCLKQQFSVSLETGTGAPMRNLMPDSLRWSWGGNTSAGEWLQIQTKLLHLLACCSSHAVCPGP